MCHTSHTGRDANRLFLFPPTLVTCVSCIIDCPTTNEVFISLLVYFDRMSRLPNLSNLTSSLPSSNTQQQGSSTSNNNNSTSMSNTTSTSSNPTNHVATATATTQNTMPLFNYNSNSNSTPSTSHARTRSSSNPVESTSTSSGNTMQPSSSSPHSTFAVDSFNIHRLIIAGVTVASKFFSDVFYTNSRYAKVRFPPPHIHTWV